MVEIVRVFSVDLVEAYSQNRSVPESGKHLDIVSDQLQRPDDHSGWDVDRLEAAAEIETAAAVAKMSQPL